MKRFTKGLIITVVLIFLGSVMLLPVSNTHAQVPTPTPVGVIDPNTVAWSGLFFNSTDFTGSFANAQYPTGLNQFWGSSSPTDGFGVPVTGIGVDNFSARFSATVDFPAGLVEFTITADDGARLLINGDPILDTLASGLAAQSAVVNLTGGSFNLVIEYVETTANALIQITWRASTGQGLPTGTPQPAATGQVVRVRGLAVRTGPFLGASMVAVARPEVTYPVLARNTQEGIFTWYKIQFDEDTVGWSSGRFLELDGDPNALPLENSTIFDQINETPNFDVIGVTRAVMNFRQRPSQRVSRVPQALQIPWGAEVEILARTVQGGQDFWYQVQYCPEDAGVCYVGWIVAAFVGIRPGVAPLDAVPVY